MKLSKCFLATITTFGFTISCNVYSTNIDTANSATGSVLPYSILRSDLSDDAKPGHKIEIRNGGYGSDMTAHPRNPNQFYALTDRGPNATFNGLQGKGKMFPVPDYTPRLGLFEVQRDGSIQQLKTILLRRPDGALITGLPNTSDFGGTGETPYDQEGKPITLDAQIPFNAISNPIKLDHYGLDGEGLVAMKDGTFWVSDEYGPHIVHYNQNGLEIDRINAFVNDDRVSKHLPAEFAHRRPNRGMEGLTITPDEKVLVGMMQSTMYNPSKEVKALDLVRLVTVNLETGTTGQYLYKQEKGQNSNSGIAAQSATEFVVIERDGAFYDVNPNAMKHLYKIDISQATNLENIKEGNGLVQDEQFGLMINGKTIEQAVLSEGWDVLKKYGIKPVEKTLLIDLVAEMKYPHDKLEGLWLISHDQIGVINDDDFATWSNDGKLEQKYLDKAQTVIDGNTLYRIDIK